MTTIHVVKRDGTREVADVSKISQVLQWAAEGLDVSVSQVELASHVQLFDGIATENIHDLMIKSAADLISVENPDYQIMAGRLNIFHLRKKAYGQFTPPSFRDHVINMVDLGKYDPEILENYTIQELDELGQYIKHERDLNLAYAATKQYQGKYLVQDRHGEGVLYETPQMALMAIAAYIFPGQPLSVVKEFYDALSLHEISLPTPIMAGVRTPTRQFSSCTVMECGDSLDSINATASAIVKYISKRAGIGVAINSVRAVGSKVGSGEIRHTGVIPFIKHFQTAVKSCSQGGVRGGAATLFYPMWHYETPELLVLKNNRGTEESRARHLDYGVLINKYLYRLLQTDADMYLFSPNDVPGLLDAFYADQDKFAELYEKYAADPAVRKRKVRAQELFLSLASERSSTGRIYIGNIDHMNNHSSFNPELAPIKQSNLCMEIALPTEAFSDVNGAEGEISLCTLAAFNLGSIEDLSRLERLAYLLVAALDNLLDYQEYPIGIAESSTGMRRPLGIGVINYAYYLAKNGFNYGDKGALNLTHRTFEAMQYYLIKASIELTKTKGSNGDLASRYQEGILPIDTYYKGVDAICDEPLHMDWEGLRKDLMLYGIRNSTLTALMPSETSSQIANATNGIEPPRGLMSVKASKDGILRQLVPDVGTLADTYQLAWNLNNKDYLNNVAIMQKFVDQSISANTYYDPARYPNGKVPAVEVLKDILYAYRMGVKTLYYHNTRDGSDESRLQETLDSATTETPVEEDCDSCKI